MSILKTYHKKFKILFIALALLGAIASVLNYYNNINVFQRQYYEEQKLNSHEVQELYTSKIKQIYRMLRTIARLPGVRKIDRYAKNFEINAKSSTQELYNNLASMSPISEVYIVPLNFEPDQMDLVTHKLQEPITTFDKLIIGKSADSSSPANPEDEVEIYEYRLMKKQLLWFKEHYPVESLIQELHYPSLIGPEVITCDNTFFSKQLKNDKDRSGMVISVPFFSESGQLKGQISGVVLSRNLRSFLDHGHHAINSKKHNYFIGSTHDALWLKYKEKILKQEKMPDLIYSDYIPLADLETDGDWVLWSAQPNEEFNSRSEVSFFRKVLAIQLFSVFFIFSGLFFALNVLQEKEKWIIDRNNALEKELEKRVNELSLTQAKIVSSSKMAELGEMSAGVAHEINNPLTLIIGKAQRGLRDLANQPSTTETISLKSTLESVVKNGERIAGIVRGLRTFSRDSSNDPFMIIDLHSVIDDSLSLLDAKIKSSGVELRKVIPSGSLLVKARTSQISQILVNLISNAFSAVEKLDDRWILLEVVKTDSKMYEIRVSDSGPGVAQELESKIFQPFFTTKEPGKGTGLGLSISQSIAKEHQGNLKLDRKLSASTFVLSLPADS